MIVNIIEYYHSPLFNGVCKSYWFTDVRRVHILAYLDMVRRCTNATFLNMACNKHVMRIDKSVLMYISAIVIVFAYGTLGVYFLGQSGNFNVKITSLTEAAYFTIVTVSTVGYGDIVPVTDIARIFVIILIIAGLSIFLSAMTVLSGEFLSSRIQKLTSETSRLSKVKLHNHIVLIGYGTTNATVADRLKAQRRNFIIILGEKPAADALVSKGYPAFLADYTLKSEMQKFSLEKATDIVIDLKESSEAVYVVLVVKKLSKKVKISVVATDKDAESHLADLEIAHVINPITIAADMLTRVLDRSQDLGSK